MLITPQIDLRRTRRAFDKITQRHDTLRTSFVKVKGSWKAQISDAHKTGVEVVDIGNVDDKTFESSVNKYAAEPISVFAPSLIEMKVLKFGSRGDALVVRVHHAITDGYGLVVFFEEFMKALIGLPLLSSPVGHAEYIKSFDGSTAKADKLNNGYWNDKILPVIPPLNWGRKAKGLPVPRENTRERTIGTMVPISKNIVAKYNERAKKNGISLYSHIVAAYADTICDNAGSDEVYIAMPVARHESRLETYVGDHSKLVLVRYKQKPVWNTDEQAKAVANDIRDSVSHLPTSAFALGGKIDKAFTESGGPMITYFAREAGPHARIKRSNFGGAIMTSEFEEQRVGLFKVKGIKLHPQAHTVAELQIDLIEHSDGHCIELGADADAFSKEELDRFAKALMKKLSN